MTTDAPSRAPAPLSTYRLQLNRFFTFQDAAALVPYLDELGVSTVYASPYLQARPGSLHGYDISNHGELSAEVGSREGHEELTRAIRERGMGHLLDIVPNHMGIGQATNPWWVDVLENGPSSPYAPYFDIDWQPLKPELAGKVLLPILGDQFGRVLERGELELRYEDGRFRIHYYEQPLPVAPKSSSLVLRHALEELGRTISEDDPERIELESIVTALEHLPPRGCTDAASVRERKRESVVTRRRLSTLYTRSAETRTALDRAIAHFNGTVGEPHTFDLLAELLDDQAYRLAYWRVAAEEINYRRFFDINDLAGVRVELGRVFEDTHRLILQLIAEGKVTGLRIDHPDGLFDPRGYLRQLQREASRRADQSTFYVIVEKILTGEEPLPADWPVAGTVGYEFLNRLNGLFVAAQHEAAMDAVYTRFIGESPDFRRLIYDKKKLILRVALASELNVLAYQLDRLSEENRRNRDFTLGSLTHALRETIACFPVYRTYIEAETGRISEGDRAHVEQAIRTAKRRNRSISITLFDFIRDILLLRWPDDLDEEMRREHARFVMKFQQLTGPVMAKGVEDTSFYIYNRLVSLNEVGGEPIHFGTSPEAFHRWIAERLEQWPGTMNATSTHDTKRSEDVRARVNVLSEIPDIWESHIRRWAEWNAPHRSTEDEEPLPDRNDEYLLYQTLVGAWPLEEMDDEAHGDFVARIQRYMEKATREAKVHTSWINPNEEYDIALREFIAHILDRSAVNPFLDDFVPFQARVARAGMLNALSQTLLKLTCPGVPDIYQGQEMWDFSLVDPDNRRPVDYDRRRTALADLRKGTPAETAQEVLNGWKDGRIKLHVTHRALRLRRKDPELFSEGAYIPLSASGPNSRHVLGFARRHEERAVLVIAPRLVETLIRSGDSELPDAATWKGTALEGLAAVPAGTYRNALTGEVVSVDGNGAGRTLPLEELLGRFPVALLERTS